jgi:hypothetical protein
VGVLVHGVYHILPISQHWWCGESAAVILVIFVGWLPLSSAGPPTAHKWCGECQV